jgi:hypothetical protein
MFEIRVGEEMSDKVFVFNQPQRGLLATTRTHYSQRGTRANSSPHDTKASATTALWGIMQLSTQSKLLAKQLLGIWRFLTDLASPLELVLRREEF